MMLYTVWHIVESNKNQSTQSKKGKPRKEKKKDKS